VLVLVLFYCLYAWQKAAVADTVSTALARLIIDKVPGVRAQKRFDVNAPPVSSPADVGFGSTGTGSPGGCTYWLLRNCVALQIDASVNRKPEILMSIAQLMRDPCRLFSLPDANDEKATSRIGERSRSDRVEIVTDYFGCQKPSRWSGEIVINVIEGLEAPPQTEITPAGGVVYQGSPRRVLFQVVNKL